MHSLIDNQPDRTLLCGVKAVEGAEEQWALLMVGHGRTIALCRLPVIAVVSVRIDWAYLVASLTRPRPDGHPKRGARRVRAAVSHSGTALVRRLLKSRFSVRELGFDLGIGGRI